MRRVHVIVSGRVQAVGFRYHTVEMAERLGLAGWVRNLPDGTVEVEAEGPDELVTDLVTWLGRGPSSARVTNLHVTEQSPTGATGFGVR